MTERSVRARGGQRVAHAPPRPPAAPAPAWAPVPRPAGRSRSPTRVARRTRAGARVRYQPAPAGQPTSSSLSPPRETPSSSPLPCADNAFLAVLSVARARRAGALTRRAARPLILLPPACAPSISIRFVQYVYPISARGKTLYPVRSRLGYHLMVCRCSVLVSGTALRACGGCALRQAPHRGRSPARAGQWQGEVS